jgi:hypothetical protein
MTDRTCLEQYSKRKIGLNLSVTLEIYKLAQGTDCQRIGCNIRIFCTYLFVVYLTALSVAWIV